MKKQHKQFLKLPEYPGGKEAFKKYLKENLRYPELALKNGIEGTVFLVAEIDDNGNVLKVNIEKGLEADCDKEAIRLIKNVRFGGVKNKGVRLKTKKKLKVNFKLPEQKSINYNIVSNKPNNKQHPPSKKYAYTINIAKNEN